jgi:hypothetical protein
VNGTGTKLGDPSRRREFRASSMYCGMKDGFKDGVFGCGPNKHQCTVDHPPPVPLSVTSAPQIIASVLEHGKKPLEKRTARILDLMMQGKDAVPRRRKAEDPVWVLAAAGRRNSRATIRTSHLHPHPS